MVSIEIPWGAWHADTTHRLRFPRDWAVEVHGLRDAPPIASHDVARAIESPIDSPSIVDLARGRTSACIAVDDLARPTRAAEVLPPVLAAIEHAGIPRAAVRIVVATGSHRPLLLHEIEWKVGARIASEYSVESHDCQGALAGTGIPYGDRELRLNRTFLEADFKLVLGSVLPHPFAGFSGGAKLVLPGLADVPATARSHKFVQMGLRGGTDPNLNRFRAEIEQIARQLGLRFAVCVVSNARRQTVGVYAGDLVAAHRAACDRAAELFSTELSGVYDLLVLNAFPKDLDLIQSEAAFVALKSAAGPVVRDGGIVLLTTAASEGIGRHGLFEPGGASYRPPQALRQLAGRELWIYAPGRTTAEVHSIYWNGYPVFDDAGALSAALAGRLTGDVRAAVLTCAPTQRVRLLESATQPG